MTKLSDIANVPGGPQESDMLYLVRGDGNSPEAFQEYSGTVGDLAAILGSPVAVDDEGGEVLSAATRLNFVGAGVSVAGATGDEAVITIPGGGGGSVAWTLADSWTYSVDVPEVDFIGLGVYSELLLVARLLTTSVAAVRSVRLSVDNGATFAAASGDYQSIANTGLESAAALIELHGSANIAARTSILWLPNAGMAGVPKICRCTNRGTVLLFVDSLDPVNALKVLPSVAANLTGGSIEIYGR